MKKIALCLSLLCTGIFATPIPVIASTFTSSYSEEKTVTAVKFNGHVRTTNHNVKVLETDNGLVAIFGGKRYTVYSSDRDGYKYMFHAGQATWYFNY